MKDRTAKKQVRHTPLGKQIDQDTNDETRIKKRIRTGKLAPKDEEEPTAQEFVNNKISRKILEQAREQLGEEDQDEDEDEEAMEGTSAPVASKKKSSSLKDTFSDAFDLKHAFDDASTTFTEAFSETESQYNRNADVAVDEEEEKAMAMFMNDRGPKRLLSDIILEKIQQHEANLKRKAQQGSAPQVHNPPNPNALKPEVVAVYRKVGEILRHYSSGKLPKAFKILPSLRNWEQLLYLTRPDQWSPVVTRMATMMFSRGMSDKLVQQFYNVVLLPKIREDIDVNKKLGFHYYLALKKALYRPAAFFRGILLPLCESGDCTLREAVIIGSVLRRVSIPATHSSVAIYKLCQFPYFGSTQHFLLTLLNKKYSLPFKVIDILVVYFMKFLQDERKLPVMWHQTLLVFVQRYKMDLTAEQKDKIKTLLHHHSHSLITPEIRRELAETSNRSSLTMPSTTTTASAMET